MRFFIDCEFNAEIGPTMELISIGIAAEDGRTYYAVSSEFDPDKCSDWVKENVFPKLGVPEFCSGGLMPDPLIVPKTLIEMRKEINEFVTGATPEFWGYFAAWDWLLLGQHIMGGMLSLPKTWPHLCMDVKQYQRHLGAKAFTPLARALEHNALNDAIWTKEYWEYLNAIEHGSPRDERRHGSHF